MKLKMPTFDTKIYGVSLMTSNPLDQKFESTVLIKYYATIGNGKVKVDDAQGIPLLENNNTSKPLPPLV